MDSIDVDASIENIVASGKSLDMLSADDLMAQELQRGRVGICFLLDISGSMTGEKSAICSIAAVMLIGRLVPEEIAIVLFESSTHVFKEFDEQQDMDVVCR